MSRSEPTDAQLRQARDEVADRGWTRSDAAAHPWRPNGKRGLDGEYLACEKCHAHTNPARWPLFFQSGELAGAILWTCSTCKKANADRAGIARVLVDVPPG